jgi:hypothetical protein
MRKTAIYALIFVILAAGVASGATMFKSSAPNAEDFCFGYAICE